MQIQNVISLKAPLLEKNIMCYNTLWSLTYILIELSDEQE